MITKRFLYSCHLDDDEEEVKQCYSEMGKYFAVGLL